MSEQELKSFVTALQSKVRSVFGLTLMGGNVSVLVKR